MMVREHNSGLRIDFGVDSSAARFKHRFDLDLRRNLVPWVTASWARGLGHLGDRRHVKPTAQTTGKSTRLKGTGRESLTIVESAEILWIL